MKLKRWKKEQFRSTGPLVKKANTKKQQEAKLRALREALGVPRWEAEQRPHSVHRLLLVWTWQTVLHFLGSPAQSKCVTPRLGFCHFQSTSWLSALRLPRTKDVLSEARLQESANARASDAPDPSLEAERVNLVWIQDKQLQCSPDLSTTHFTSHPDSRFVWGKALFTMPQNKKEQKWTGKEPTQLADGLAAMNASGDPYIQEHKWNVTKRHSDHPNNLCRRSFQSLGSKKGLNTNWKMRPSQEGRTPWAMSEPDRAAWSRGFSLESQQSGPQGGAAAMHRAQNCSWFQRINHSQLNALMQSLSWNYSIMKYRSYPLTWHCSWNTVPLFWDKNEMPLTQSICTVKAQLWVEQKMHCHGKCFYEVSKGQVSTLFTNNTDKRYR